MTSQATRSSSSARRTSRLAKSTAARSGIGPGSGSGEPPRYHTPSARSNPEPPSVVALPPTPMTTCRTPASRTARRISPVPSVVAASGARGSSAGRRDSPDASASSTAPLSPSSERSQRAVSGRPSASWAGHSCHSQPPLSAIAASVPSPPSASGARISSSPGRARDQPEARARATWTEVSEPLKESGASRTRRRRASAPLIGARPPARP